MMIAYIVIAILVIAMGMLIRSYRRHMTLDDEVKAEVEQWLQREKDKTRGIQ